MKITEKELQRLQKLTEIDRTYWDQPGVILAGMDEVGRGPLAGPVVVGCVVMPPEPLLPYVNDSKKLSEKRREALYDQILATALAHSTAWIGPDIIDEINILEATKRGFAEAFAKIGVPVNPNRWYFLKLLTMAVCISPNWLRWHSSKMMTICRL